MTAGVKVVGLAVLLALVFAMPARAQEASCPWMQAGKSKPHLATSFWFAIGDDAHSA